MLKNSSHHDFVNRYLKAVRNVRTKLNTEFQYPEITADNSILFFFFFSSRKNALTACRGYIYVPIISRTHRTIVSFTPCHRAHDETIRQFRGTRRSSPWLTLLSWKRLRRAEGSWARLATWFSSSSFSFSSCPYILCPPSSSSTRVVTLFSPAILEHEFTLSCKRNIDRDRPL